MWPSKFVLAKELFVPKLCFIRHLTVNTRAMFLWIPLQVIFSIWYFRLQLKTKIWNYIVLVSILVKQPVFKRFSIVLGLEVCINLSTKINTSLARTILIVILEYQVSGFFCTRFEVKFSTLIQTMRNLIG